jgi:hypothetical protein
MTNKEFNELISNLIESGRSSEVPILLEQRARKFWEEEYPEKNRLERFQYWVSYIGRQLRWNVESGVSVENYFDSFNYEYWKNFEPDIESIIAEVKETIVC